MTRFGRRRRGKIQEDPSPWYLMLAFALKSDEQRAGMINKAVDLSLHGGWWGGSSTRITPVGYILNMGGCKSEERRSSALLCTPRRLFH